MTADKPAKQPKIPPAFLPPKWDLADAGAIQACLRGEALPHQQKRAIEFIVREIAKTYDQSYRPGGLEGDRETAFAEGKRFVGTQVVMLGQLNLAPYRSKKNEPTESGY